VPSFRPRLSGGRSEPSSARGSARLDADRHCRPDQSRSHVATRWRHGDRPADCGRIRHIPSPRRMLVAPIVSHVQDLIQSGSLGDGAVDPGRATPTSSPDLAQPTGVVLATALQLRTDAVVATLSFRIDLLWARSTGQRGSSSAGGVRGRRRSTSSARHSSVRSRGTLRDLPVCSSMRCNRCRTVL
jgi:hypothetical protein